MTELAGEKRFSRWGILSLLLLTFLIYSNSFQGSFQYDDIHTIVKNPHLKHLSQLSKFFIHPETGSGIYQETQSYRPLLMVTFALNYALGELNVFGYHFFNLVIHVLSAIFIYFICCSILRAESPAIEESRRSRAVALFAALVFAVHPVQTESVSYITGRSSSLTGLLFLGSFLSYIHYRRTGKTYPVFVSSVLYALALLVKEIAITLPVILVLYELFFHPPRRWKRLLLWVSPHLAVSGMYLGIRYYFFGLATSSAVPIRPLYDHVLTQFPAWVHYLGTLMFPLNLNLMYDFPIAHSFLESTVLVSFFVLFAVAVLMWKLSRISKAAGFFALWFAVTLLPTNTVIALEDVVTDRWLYLPSVGYAVIFALTAEWIFRKAVYGGGRERKLVFFFLCALVIEIYGYSAVLRNFTWNNEWMLWEDTEFKSPGLARPHNGLGLALSAAGRLDEAVLEFKKAAEMDTRYPNPHVNLGMIYYLQGKFPEAIEANRKAISLSFSAAGYGHNNLGLIYFEQGIFNQAISEFKEAIKLRPLEPSPFFNLANVYERMGNIDLAIAYQEKTVHTDPNFSGAYRSLRELYRKKGWKEKSEEADKRYRQQVPGAKPMGEKRI